MERIRERFALSRIRFTRFISMLSRIIVG